MRRVNRHRQHPLAVALVNRIRQTAGLPPEHQHDVFREFRFCVHPDCFRAEEKRLAETRQLALEVLPRRPEPEIDVLPVIEAGAAHLALVERKAEGLDEVESGSGGEAGTPRISGVPVNLGVDENDVDAHDVEMRRLLVLSLVLLALPAAAAKQRSIRHPSPAPPHTGPTFSKEVVRIFQQHCQTCHHEGDIAPFSLVTHDEAKPYAQLIKFMTQTREMPPWKPAEGCGDFRDERRLSDEEIATIAQWVDAGAPEGNRGDLPAPLDFGGGWALGQPDLVLSSPEAFTPPAGTDTYRCFTIPTNFTSDTYVRAVDTHPGNRAVVHHVISFVDHTGESVRLDEAEPGPGYTCFGGPGFDLPGTLGGWAPGSRPLEMPEDVGFEVTAGSRVVLQVHYHPHESDSHNAHHVEPDRTEFGIYLAKEKPAKVMRIIPLINTSFTIPPHDANYRVDAEFPIPTPFPVTLWLVAPHMHLLGRKMTVQMTPPGGPAQCLIDIQDWDFNWQGAYRYRDPVSVPAGSRISLSAYYDNSASNPRNPNNPPKPVSWGEATTDEMCIAFLGVTVD